MNQKIIDNLLIENVIKYIEPRLKENRFRFIKSKNGFKRKQDENEHWIYVIKPYNNPLIYDKEEESLTILFKLLGLVHNQGFHEWYKAITSLDPISIYQSQPLLGKAYIDIRSISEDVRARNRREIDNSALDIGAIVSHKLAGLVQELTDKTQYPTSTKSNDYHRIKQYPFYLHYLGLNEQARTELETTYKYLINFAQSQTDPVYRNSANQSIEQFIKATNEVFKIKLLQ